MKRTIASILLCFATAAPLPAVADIPDVISAADGAVAANPNCPAPNDGGGTGGEPPALRARHSNLSSPAVEDPQSPEPNEPPVVRFPTGCSASPSPQPAPLASDLALLGLLLCLGAAGRRALRSS